MIPWTNFTNKKTLEYLKTMLVPFLPALVITSKRHKKLVWPFSFNLDRRKISPLAYVTFCGQACLPSLLCGVKVFKMTQTLVAKLECVNHGFSRPSFMHPILRPTNCYKNCQILIPSNLKLTLKSFYLLAV